MSDREWHKGISLLERYENEVQFSWKHYWNLAWCYFKIEDYEKAVQVFKKALYHAEKRGAQATCLCFLGITLNELEDYKQAKKLLGESLRLKDSTLTRMTLAITYMELNNFDQAELIHTQGIQLAPNDAERLNAYALFLEDMEREDDAAEIYLHLMQLTGKPKQDLS